MTLTLLDAILFAIMLVSALLAMVRGFSREVLSVVAWLVAAAAAFFFYRPLTPYVSEYIASDMVALAVSAALIFLLTLIVVSFITLRIADFIIDSRVGAIDRALGFVFGAVRGLLLVVVAMLFFNWLAPANQPQWVADARSKPFLDDLGQRLVAALPDNPEQVIMDQIQGTDGEPDAVIAPEGTDGEPVVVPVPDATEAPGEPSSIEGLIDESGDTPPPAAN